MTIPARDRVSCSCNLNCFGNPLEINALILKINKNGFLILELLLGFKKKNDFYCHLGLYCDISATNFRF